MGAGPGRGDPKAAPTEAGFVLVLVLLGQSLTRTLTLDEASLPDEV
jgi:hypothetical protein